MLTEHGSYIQQLDRAITLQLAAEEAQRHAREAAPGTLTDGDLELLYSKAELKSLGSCDALFGDAPRYPSSLTYMQVYKRRQENGTWGTGKRDLNAARALSWGVDYQVAGDEQ